MVIPTGYNNEQTTKRTLRTTRHRPAISPSRLCHKNTKSQYVRLDYIPKFNYTF